jgi:hypothetical protein
MADPDQPGPASTVFLPVSEAASHLRLTPNGLRSRIRRGMIRTKRGNQGQHLVEVPRDPPPAYDQPLTHEPDEELLAELDSLRRELSEERLVRARIEERLAGIERAHAAELGARDSTITDLRAKLARLRLPFWRRWLG